MSSVISMIGGAPPAARARAVVLLALPWVAAGCGETVLPDPDVRYVALGDSTTAGPADRDYPQFLTDLLAEPAESFANEGEGGQTTDEALELLRQRVSAGIYPNAHTLLYWGGGGDIIDFIGEADRLLLFSPAAEGYPYTQRLTNELDRVQANIESIIAEGQAAGWTVYVATFFFSRETLAPCDALFLDLILPSQARNANAYIALLNERIREAATNRGARLVDVESIDDRLRASGANFLDCSHLSNQGNAIVAEVFSEAIQE